MAQVKCACCGETYDDTVILHEPVMEEKLIGSATMKYCSGCKEITVEKGESDGAR